MPTGPDVQIGDSDLDEREQRSQDFLRYPKAFSPAFDRATGTLSMTAQLKNISKDIVEGPTEVRVLTLESEIGVPEITNADNGESGTGAVWDFSSQLLKGRLSSMALSTPKALTFRMSDLYPLGQGRDRKYKLGRL